MATVMLPEALGSTADDAATVRDALLFGDRIEVQVHAFRGRLYARVCGQIYNELADIERLAAAVLALAARVTRGADGTLGVATSDVLPEIRRSGKIFRFDYEGSPELLISCENH